MYLPRQIVSRLTAALRRMPVVVLSGLRQTGKSTLLTKEPELAQRRYRTFDDFAVLQAATANPEELLAGSTPITLDEVQKAPGLLTAIKAEVDRARRPGRFLLSGSANLALMADVSETLAGRAVYLTLHPMTRREIRNATQTEPAFLRFTRDGSFGNEPADPVTGAEVLLGGLPPVSLDEPEGAAIWFEGYVQTYIERDVRQLSQVADALLFRTFVQLAALRTGQILNISALGRDARLNATTTARYLNLLESSFLVRRLPPFVKNRSSRLIKSPKLLFTDSGLAAHLAGVTTLAPDAAEPLRGALYETWLAQNLSALLDAHLPGASLSYWHEQGRHEVDLVIEHGRKVYAVEAKAASRWAESDLAGLKAFLERTPACEAALLAYNGAETVKLGKKLWAVPMGRLVG